MTLVCWRESFAPHVLPRAQHELRCILHTAVIFSLSLPHVPVFYRIVSDSESLELLKSTVPRGPATKC